MTLPTRRGLAALGLLGSAAHADQPIRLLSGGALEPAVATVMAAWRDGGGGPVEVAFATAPPIADRLAQGERPDLLLAPVAQVEELRRAGRLAAAPVPLGAVGVGIAVREGAPRPPIGDVAALRAALLSAETVVFNRASTGLYVERLLVRLGLAEALAPRILRFPDGEGVLHRIATGRGEEIGLAAMTEILLFQPRGVRLVGPLPAEVQNRTEYAAGLMEGGDARAAQLLAFLDRVNVRAAMRRAGLD